MSHGSTRIHTDLRAPLGSFVDRMWYYEDVAWPHRRELALPTGTVSIVFNLSEDRVRNFASATDVEGRRFPGAIVSGAYSSHFVRDTSTPRTTVGVHFRPGGAAPFLGVPASEVADRHLALEDVWGSPGRILRERLLDAGSPDEIFAVLERALLTRIHKPLLIHPAVAHALGRLDGSPTLSRVDRVREETGYGPKRFIELFRDAVGLTPKVYSRVRRFGAVIDRLSRGARVEWADVAAESGYCDQSHLNREFRRFAGITPTGYRPVGGDRVFHVAVDG